MLFCIVNNSKIDAVPRIRIPAGYRCDKRSVNYPVIHMWSDIFRSFSRQEPKLSPIWSQDGYCILVMRIVRVTSQNKFCVLIKTTFLT